MKLVKQLHDLRNRSLEEDIRIKICDDKNCSKIAILNLSSKHVGTLNVYVAYEPTHASYHYLQIRVEGHVASSAVPPTVTAVVAVTTLTT